MSNRDSITIDGHKLFIDYIMMIIPSKKAIVIHPHESYLPLADDPKDSANKFGIFCSISSDQVLKDIKFKYINYIKTLPNPEDRVAAFEYKRDDGSPDFEKMDRLIERRKTRKEKQIELNEEIETKKLCEKHRIKYYGPLSHL
jgi:hypothetical protein